MKSRALLALILVSSLTSFAIRPDREYKSKPDVLGLKYTEYQVETPDHYLLNTWEYEVPVATSADRTIILAQTDAGNMSYYIWLAKSFLDRGIRVITFDYRGFGKSTDFAINTELLYHNEFAIDLDSVIRSTRQRFPKSKIGVYGLSMGSYISLLRKEPVEFMVADGFYYDPQLLVERIKVEESETVPLPEGSRAILKLEPVVPCLIFSASNDKRTTTADAKAFASTNSGSSFEYTGDHLHGFSVLSKDSLGDEYVARIIRFLTENNL